MATLTAVTVGGVYAAWTYAEKDVTDITSAEQVVQVAGINTSEVLKVGSLDIKASDDFAITIDAASAVYPDDYETKCYHQHEAVLVVTGTITVTFTATAQAAQDIQDYGLLTDVYFSSPKNITLEDIKWGEGEGAVQIFQFSELRHQLGGANDESDGAEWTKSTNAEGLNVFTYTFDNEELKGLFTLTEDIVLDTAAKHAQFEQEVAGVSATLHVTQVKTAVTE